MKSPYRQTLPVISLMLLTGCMNDVLSGPELERAEPPINQMQETDDYLVLLRDETITPVELAEAIGELGGSIVHQHGEIGFLRVRGLTDESANELAERPEIAGVRPDALMQWITPVADRQLVRLRGRGHRIDRQDPTQAAEYARQWNMRQIDADGAWPVTRQGEGTLVCTIDTGIDPYHNDLVGKVDASTSKAFVASTTDGPEWGDDNFHGTMVAGIIASNGSVLASVAPLAKLCAIKVLNFAGFGSPDALIDGIMHAAKVRADVINMSLGESVPISPDDPIVTAMQRAVNFAIRRGALVVASAGNGGLDLDATDNIIIPAQLQGVLSVGATLINDQAAPYSNFGTNLLDIVAPGGDDPTVDPALALAGPCSTLSALGQIDPDLDCEPGDILLEFRTSFAAPHVSGAAAVIQSTQPGNRRAFWLTACLLAGADRLDGQRVSPHFGHGRLNVLGSAQQFGCGKLFLNRPEVVTP